MRSMRELMKVLSDGDHIKDDELEFMIKELGKLRDQLEAVWHEPYRLVLVDVWEKVERLLRYREARKRQF